MFYASRVMTALSELESAIVHHEKSDEDAMFAMIKRCKAAGIKPAEAAASYYVAEAERGIAAAPDAWIPMVEQAIKRIRVWAVVDQGCRPHAERLVALLREAEQGDDEA